MNYEMKKATNIELLENCLGGLRLTSQMVYDRLKQLKNSVIDQALIEKGDAYLSKTMARMNRMKTIYDNFTDQINSNSDTYLNNIRSIYDEAKSEFVSLQNEQSPSRLLEKNDEFIKNENSRKTQVSSLYNLFAKQLKEICSNYLNEINNIEVEEEKDLNELKEDIKSVKNGLEITKKAVDKNCSIPAITPSFVFQGNKESKGFTIELISHYNGCRLYKEFIKERKEHLPTIFIDRDNKNEESIVKYMNNDRSLLSDIDKMETDKKVELLKDLDWFELPIKNDYISRLYYGEDNEMMDTWREHRLILVNNNYSKEFNDLLQKNNLIDSIYQSQSLRNIKYNRHSHSFFINFDLQYQKLVESYLMHDRHFVKDDLTKTYSSVQYKRVECEFRWLGLPLTVDELMSLKMIFYNPMFKSISRIINLDRYDRQLQEWVGYQYDWKIIYRASEHNFSAESFHRYCDDKGPTLIIFKCIPSWFSSAEYIFGGYTTRSWKAYPETLFKYEMKEDPNAFLFTLQNPFNTPPMKFGKSTTMMSAIGCGLQYGPIFGDVTGRADILINNECSKRYGCVINNDGSQGFECNPTHKKSLFVNTSYPNKENYCSITDYEVYCINNYKDYIYSSCQYPDLLWNNIDKHIISEDTWKAHCKSKRFLADLNSLCCYSEAIQSQLLEKPITMPSLFLSSSIIDSSYDQYLNQWLGEDYLWRMIYRASKNNFSPEAFHQCCDEKRPTLVLIKTVEGWIFGEYTTHSWKRTDSDESKPQSKYDTYSFAFILKNNLVKKPEATLGQYSLFSALCDPQLGPSLKGSSNYQLITHYENYKGEEVKEVCPSDGCFVFVNLMFILESKLYKIADYEVFTHV